MKSEGIKDIVEWMELKIKAQKQCVDQAEKTRSMVWYEGEYQDRARNEERVRLETMVSWKISTEKYMKKLQHEGQ